MIDFSETYLPPRARKVADRVAAQINNHNREARLSEATLAIRWGRVRIVVPRRGGLGSRDSAEGWVIDTHLGDVRNKGRRPFKTFREVQAFTVGITDAAVGGHRYTSADAEAERRRQGDARMETDAEWAAYRSGLSAQDAIRTKLRNSK